MDFPIKTTLVFKSSIFIAWLDYSRFVNPQVSTTISLYRNINLLSIGYSAGWRTYLRSRLTPHRRPLCGKPWVFGVRHSQPDFVTHSGILTPINSSPTYIVTFSVNGTLPYQLAPCARIRINPNYLFCLRSFGIIREMRKKLFSQSHSRIYPNTIWISSKHSGLFGFLCKAQVLEFRRLA